MGWVKSYTIISVLAEKTKREDVEHGSSALRRKAIVLGSRPDAAARDEAGARPVHVNQVDGDRPLFGRAVGNRLLRRLAVGVDHDLTYHAHTAALFRQLAQGGRRCC